jgi:hypothetical protein
MCKKIFIIILLAGFTAVANAQELNAKVTVVAGRVGNSVNRNVFSTLQTAISNFINNRKWSTDAFAPNERIDCNFLINLEQGSEPNVYTASLTIQAARPVFNTSYVSPIINFKDDNIIFKYVEFQQLEFNENRVSGNDALVSNLTAVLAYYADMILAFDYMSFAQGGGTPFLQKAQSIVNNAPDGRGISGWKAFDGIRNRYWLTENLLNPRYAVMQDVYYNYYRQGLDKMFEDEAGARTAMLGVLTSLEKFNADNPNTMINQFFFQGKSNELIKIFSKALPQDKSKAQELLAKLDISNSGKYKDELK